MKEIRCLWLHPHSQVLWGIPHTMRPGQSPRDLWDAGNVSGWIHLTWIPRMGLTNSANISAIDALLARARKQDAIPAHPGEWCELETT